MNNKEITKNAHNAIAKRYYEEYKDDTTDFIYIDKFLEKCKSKILDLGCGMGQYSKYMKSKGLAVVGVDFSKEMLKIAQANNPDCLFVESDICNLPENLDRDFDGVLIAYVIQHLSKKELKICLTNLNNYIKESANILIFFREGNKILDEVEPFDERFTYVIKEYDSKEITQLLNECGYDVTNIEEKPYVDDKYSVCPKTLVLYAKKVK